MPDLFDLIPPAPAVEAVTFDGPALEAADHARLAVQLERVKGLMRDGAWRTPEQMEAATGYRWASISARLRDLRKVPHGGHTVERQKRGGGQFAYRVILNAGA